MTDKIELVRTGRVWKFGDQINTDLILPQVAFRLPEEEQKKYVFSAIRPGWTDLITPGDLLIGGENFGMGSARPIGTLLRLCGIHGLVAETVNGLCVRSLVNGSVPAMSCPGVSALFEEGDTARIDFISGTVENVTRGGSLRGRPLPYLLAEIVAAGGVIPMLIREDYVESERTKAVT